MSSPVVSPQFRPEWMNLLIPVCRRERYPSRHKLNKSLKPVHEQRIVLSLRPGQGQAPKAQLLQQGAKQLVKAVETFRSFGWARDSLSENLYTKALAKYFVIGVQYLVRNWLRPACDDLVESNRDVDNSKFQDLGDLKKFLIEHQNMLEIQGNESSVPTDEPWTILLRGALHKHVLEQRNTAIEEIRKRLVKDGLAEALRIPNGCVPGAAAGVPLCFFLTWIQREDRLPLPVLTANAEPWKNFDRLNDVRKGARDSAIGDDHIQAAAKWCEKKLGKAKAGGESWAQISTNLTPTDRFSRRENLPGDAFNKKLTIRQCCYRCRAMYNFRETAQWGESQRAEEIRKFDRRPEHDGFRDHHCAEFLADVTLKWIEQFEKMEFSTYMRERPTQGALT